MNAIFTKSYARKPDARKAALKAGLQEGTFNVTPTDDGRFGVTPVKAPKGEKGVKFGQALQMVQIGATASDIMEATNWSKHTVTNFLCTLRTVQGLQVDRKKNESGVYVYKTAA